MLNRNNLKATHPTTLARLATLRMSEQKCLKATHPTTLARLATLRMSEQKCLKATHPTMLIHLASSSFFLFLSLPYRMILVLDGVQCRHMQQEPHLHERKLQIRHAR